eukprot:scaffold3051_cov236-Pinguiococcus_pyrenoidosus.AAC.1
MGSQNNTDDLRAFRLNPWRSIWVSHAPPQLLELRDGDWHRLPDLQCIRHEETAAVGLVFTHHAYVLEEQVRFKEAFYGYGGAVH